MASHTCTHTCTLTQGLTQLIYFSNKLVYTEIVKREVDSS